MGRSHGARLLTLPRRDGAPYARALAAGTKYLLLGQQLQGRYRDIRRADDLGDAAALTPDYRMKIKKARELHQHLLDDYREMRVAFYDQLGAEMRPRRAARPAQGGGNARRRAPRARRRRARPDASAWTMATSPRPTSAARPAAAPRAAREARRRRRPLAARHHGRARDLD